MCENFSNSFSEVCSNLLGSYHLDMISCVFMSGSYCVDKKRHKHNKCMSTR